MFQLAWRQMRLDPLRTVLTAVALGTVIAVILVLKGFEQGQYRQLERTVLDRGADLVATQAGVSNFMARSSVPQLAREEVEAVEGVVVAHPLTALYVIYEEQGVRTPSMLFVIDEKGGPPSILEGRSVLEDRDIIIDRSLARKYGLRVGDPFVVSEFEFTVSAIAEDSAAFFSPFLFISYDGMIDFFLDSEIAPDISTFPLLSFLLIEVDPAADRMEVGREIQARVPSVDVFAPEELAVEDVRMGRGLFRPIMGTLVMVGYGIGLLVVGLLMYAEVASRSRSFAVLKALGFSSGRLTEAVLLQAGMLLLAGLPIGVLLARGVAALIERLAPLYPVPVFEPSILAETIAASLIFAGAGALVPLGRIRRADPMLAFEGT